MGMRDHTDVSFPCALAKYAALRCPMWVPLGDVYFKERIELIERPRALHRSRATLFRYITDVFIVNYSQKPSYPTAGASVNISDLDI